MLSLSLLSTVAAAASWVIPSIWNFKTKLVKMIVVAKNNKKKYLKNEIFIG